MLGRIATVDEVARVAEVFAGPLGAFVLGQVLRGFSRILVARDRYRLYPHDAKLRYFLLSSA